MDKLLSGFEIIGRYVSLIRITDLLDIAILAFLIYKLLCLVRSSRAENILKGVVILIVALWLSNTLQLLAVN